MSRYLVNNQIKGEKKEIIDKEENKEKEVKKQILKE